MKEKIDALKETFLLLPEWADRYNYLVELGESLPAMPVAFQVPDCLQFYVVFLRVLYPRRLLYICFCQCCYTCRVSRHAF